MSRPIRRRDPTENGGRTAALRREPSRRSGKRSFAVAAAVAFLAFAANAAASPLYRVYQVRFGFSATTLTLLFTVYIVVLLVTLLLFGSVSDYLGRRPVILAGLAVGALSCGLFLVAQGVGALFAARAVQGVAVGLIGGTASAALLDLRPGGRVAPLVSSVAPSGGQALGALGASALAQYAPAPIRFVWWLLLGAFVLGGIAIWAMPEPGMRHPGVVMALSPRIGVPRAARSAFAVAVPCLLAVWALAGFYLSLGPSLAELLSHSDNLLWGGIAILLFTGLAGIASAALVKGEPALVMLGGCVVLIAGAVVTFVAVATRTSVTFLIGTGAAGFGFGPAFAGAYRAVTAQVAAGERAELITVIYLVGYLATGVPVVIGGIATSHYGLHDTALGYSLVVAALAAGAVILLIGRIPVTGAMLRCPDAPAPPPGPGTVPPCPPVAMPQR